MLRAATALALASSVMLVSASAAASSGSPQPAADVTAHLAYTNSGCNHPSTKPHVAHCLSVVATGSDHQIRADAADPPPTALGPADIQAAYNLPAAGHGQTVGIVDANGDSTAEADLAVFRSHYGLPPCTTANGCFRKVDQRGGTDYPPDDPGWGTETSLDLDAVSAACPNCNILLVQGDSPSFDDLGIAVDTAVALGAKYVSNSYGGGDADAASFDHYYDHPGVAVTASTGDVGNEVNWPSSSGNVVAVGGTRLTENSSTQRGWDEVAWADGGSGCSAFEPKPAYQSANGLDTHCDQRATADISADADPFSGLAVYDTLGQAGWLQIGGTSLSSPLVAAMYALAGTPAPGTYPVTYPYDPAHSAGLYDVTDGTNGGCGNLLCQAGPGWDGPTGLGSPHGVTALASGPHGDVAGTVTNAATGTPIAGATVSTPGGYRTTTDGGGHYDLGVLAGTYDVTATAFGYGSATTTGVAVSDGHTTTVDFVLVPVNSSVVSGTVTDGSGHGWPLYARVSIDGYPNGDVFTDPFTGRYSVTLPQQNSYTVHVSPVYEPGYATQVLTLPVGTSDSVTRDVSVPVDLSTCAAPGYGWKGTSAQFTGWGGGTPQDGWTVRGSSRAWRFDNPGSRTPPMIPNGQFAVADSNHYGPARMDTSLVSPVINLSGQSAPIVGFDTAYYGTPMNESGTVDLSVDGGRSWTTIWRQTTGDALGHVSLDIPRAANKAAVEVRFHYTARDSWWWAVDNIFVGTHTCVPVAGGLVHGTVTDTAGQPVIGAIVTSNGRPIEEGVSVATPNDPNLPDGYYWMFSSLTGGHRFTATGSGYKPSTATVNVAATTPTRHDWTLSPS